MHQSNSNFLIHYRCLKYFTSYKWIGEKEANHSIYIYIYIFFEWKMSIEWLLVKKKKEEEGGGGGNEKRNGKNIREGASVIKVPVHRSSCAIKRVTWLSCSQVVPRRHTATYNETSYRDSQIWNNDKW